MSKKTQTKLDKLLAETGICPHCHMSACDCMKKMDLYIWQWKHVVRLLDNLEGDLHILKSDVKKLKSTTEKRSPGTEKK